MASSIQVEERVLIPEWSPALVVLSYCISWLGAYTSTQIVIHAKYTRNPYTRWLWTFLASVAYGFSAIWSMHFVGMLACGVNVKITFNKPLTAFSAFVAVAFTFAALAGPYVSDAIETSSLVLALSRVGRRVRSGIGRLRSEDVEAGGYIPISSASDAGDDAEVCLQHSHREEEVGEEAHDDHTVLQGQFDDGRQHIRRRTSFSEPDRERMSVSLDEPVTAEFPPPPPVRPSGPSPLTQPQGTPRTSQDESLNDSLTNTDDSTSNHSAGRRLRSNSGSLSASLSGTTTTTSSNTWNESLHAGLSRETRLRIKAQATDRPVPEFGWRYWVKAHYKAISPLMFVRAAIWALAIVFMHYSGMWAMEIPSGRISWNLPIVALSYVVAFATCFVACLAMVHMEVHFGRQVAFSTIASAGISAMHYTGMAAATFYTRAPADTGAGYPTYLPFAIVGIAVIVCAISNAVLAHAAINSRNRMAEMILTKRRLWRIMAEKEAAEQANELKQQFISVASHEIRTPLHAVNGYCELLALTTLTEEQALYVKSIQQACHAINVIAGNVLDFSKLDRNNVELSARPVLVDLRKMVEDLAKIMETKSIHPGQPTVDVVVAVADDVPPTVYLDETYTFRILMNLLSNAQKFCDSGYISVSVAQESRDQITIKVSDSGCGIPKSFRSALFQPFRQADTSLTRPRQGTGLGLSIVKHLLQRMNGTIDVESVEGVGSTFTVKLPATTPPRSPTATSGPLPLRKRISVLHRNDRTSQLFVELFAQFGCIATSSSVQTHLYDLIPSTDIVWADVESVVASPALQDLLSSRNHRTLPPLIIVYSNNSDLAPLESALSAARGVILVERPVIMHSLMSILEDPQAHMGKHIVPQPAAKVRFALPEDLVTPKDEKELELELEGLFGSGSVPRVPLPPPSPSPPLPPPETPIVADRATVLLVEDNTINRNLGSRLLEKLGYAVVTASDGQEAVEKVKSHTLICCLMDCQMPILDGFAATSKIRELESNGAIHGRLPIIALTANVSTDNEEKCKAAGMDHFLSKPLKLADLRTTISQYAHDPHQ